MTMTFDTRASRIAAFCTCGAGGGSDHLGLEKPDETFYALKDGADYGWASCYSSNGKIFFDTTPPNTLKKPTARLK